MLKHIWLIARLNFRMEWQLQSSYLAVLVYILSTAYLTFLVYNGIITPQTWNTFYWVIFLFAAIQAAYRSLEKEGERRFLLYLGMVKPETLILGKILYNSAYLFATGILVLGIFILFLGNLVHDPAAFLLLIGLAALGFAGILTFVAGLSAKAGSNPALPAVLSIPLLYPQILVLSRVSLQALTGFSWSLNSSYLSALLLLALVSILLAYVLFPYLWRD